MEVKVKLKMKDAEARRFLRGEGYEGKGRDKSAFMKYHIKRQMPKAGRKY